MDGPHAYAKVPSRAFRSISRRSVIKGFGAATSVSLLSSVSGRWSNGSAQEATPVAIQQDLNVPYREGNDPATQLDVYWTDHDQPIPAVIVIHGGALAFGSRNDEFGFALMAQSIAQAGYVTFNIDYRLFSTETGANPWPTQLDDAQQVVRWIRENASKYGVDPERIGAIGHSSGGQLAAFLGTRDTRDNSDASLAGYSSRVNAVVDLAGYVDATIPLSIEDFQAVTVALLGGTADNPPSADQIADFSPIDFVDPQSAPFLTLHGAIDEVVPVEISRRMTDSLHEAGVEVVYGEFPGIDHLGVLDWTLVGSQALAFLDRHLQTGQ